jgi:hypothetical protein
MLHDISSLHHPLQNLQPLQLPFVRTNKHLHRDSHILDQAGFLKSKSGEKTHGIEEALVS